MTTFDAVWICGCIIVAFLGVSVEGNAVPYPGRPALLSYSPARGEFPVASLFGRGFFSYIDGSGNSRIISLEPNPLQGVRIDSEGRPLLEIDLKSADRRESCENKNEQRKRDKLKPIKEFDEHPFLDTELEKDAKLPELDALKEDNVDPSKDLQAIAGETKQLFVFPSDLPGFLAATEAPHISQSANIAFQTTEGPPAAPSDAQTPGEPPVTRTTPQPSPPTIGAYIQAKPELSISYLPPKAIPEPTQAKPELSLSYLPPKAAPGPVFLNPQNPFLPQNTNSIPTTPPALITSTPSTTSTPAAPASTTSPALAVPSTPGSFYPPSAPSTMSAFPSFAPGNPFLPSTTAFPNPPPPSTPIFPNPPEQPSSTTAFPNPLPPSSTVFPNPPPPPSPVFQNPPPPPTARPPPNNPFLSPEQPPKPRPTAAKPTPQFNADKMNPFLPIVAPTNLQPALSSPQPHTTTLGIPEQVKDTPEVEQAKREHFLAHQMALAQLQLAQQQEDAVKRDETSSVSPAVSPCSHQAVTSGRSNTIAPEPTEDSPHTTDAVPL